MYYFDYTSPNIALSVKPIYTLVFGERALIFAFFIAPFVVDIIYLTALGIPRTSFSTYFNKLDDTSYGELVTELHIPLKHNWRDCTPSLSRQRRREQQTAFQTLDFGQTSSSVCLLPLHWNEWGAVDRQPCLSDVPLVQWTIEDEQTGCCLMAGALALPRHSCI